MQTGHANPEVTLVARRTVIVRLAFMGVLGTLGLAMAISPLGVWARAACGVVKQHFVAQAAEPAPKGSECSAEVCFELGTLELKSGSREKALELFDQALRLDPGHAAACLKRGLTKQELGQQKQAIEDFDRALELRPEFAEAYRERASTKANLGRFSSALDDFDRALELGLAPRAAEAARERRAQIAAHLGR